jgi:hypothetical protein
MTLSQLSDAQLISNFQGLVIEEREKLVLRLEHLAEMDRRKLFFHYSSLRAYLVEEHGLEEWNAERRIRAARMLKRFPEIKSKMESGRLNLTLLEIAQGCAHREKLSDSELLEIVDVISGMSCRAAKREIASRFPASMELPMDRIRPLTAKLSEVSFVAYPELLSKLEDIRGLLAHSHPQIKMGELIELLADDYRDRHHPEEKAKRAKEREMRKRRSEIVDSPTAPRVRTEEQGRTPSQAIVHELTGTKGYKCSYVDPVTQQHCHSQHGLELDHIQAWSVGGETSLRNIRYLCKSHHRRVSFLEFGESSQYARPG